MPDREPSRLHPTFRAKAERLIAKLSAEQIPFRLFEGFRSPARQRMLYAKGRTAPGKRVTRARPWQSFHQYGVAGDFVLYEDGRWSWNTKEHRKQWWERLHILGEEEGLKALSFELPHLQLQDLSLADLRAGRYPEGGDASWADNLAEAITEWPGGGAPPIPAGTVERPPLPDDAFEAAVDVGPSPEGGVPHRVIARSGLRLRAGPSTAFDSLRTLPVGMQVFVAGRDGDWAQVDLQGDGLVDGFSHAAFLRPLG